jgi:beta-xylosidase
VTGAVAQSTATLTGSVDPEGTATSYYFEYGPTDTYGSETEAQRAGSDKLSEAAVTVVSGLGALVTYHYRLVAVSRGGTTYGADATFTTTGYYQNPVYSAAAFADPFVLDNGRTHSDYWAFGTGELFPVLHSSDLVNWTSEGTAMTTRPGWIITSGDWHPWAPSVIQSGQSCPGTASSSCYIMYYVGVSAQLTTNCIGVATSPTPGGPYSDQGPLELTGTAGESGPTATVPGTPIGCGDQGGKGNIDPSPFIDPSGQPYLYVSTDHSCTGGSCAVAPTISVIPLASDLLAASGPRVALFPGVADTWEAAGVQVPTVEGPFMELHDGTYYLFYSAGSYGAAYGTGYATAVSPVGPFTKSPSNPIFSGTSTVFGPGGGDELVTGPHGGLWMLYAARQASSAATRTLWLDPFVWQPASTAGAPDIPVITGPTSTPQPTQP